MNLTPSDDIISLLEFIESKKKPVEEANINEIMCSYLISLKMALINTYTEQDDIAMALSCSELIGNIFKLDNFRVEKELTKDLIFKYKIYSGKWIRYQIVINLSEKLYLNKNKPSNPVAINSYFSNNLFDKADNNGKLKFRNYNMSSDFLVECHRNSITFTTYIID